MGSKWETVRLGDLTKWSSGGTPNKSEDSYWNGTIPWISASSMEGHLYSDSKLKITEDGLINGSRLAPAKEGANKRGNSSRLTQSFHFFMFESIFSPVNALNQPI
ncbi:restriction endonuclease subunit S [Escherichia coli]|nr:restriction endonuclease subunit S [Escherichia coli]